MPNFKSKSFEMTELQGASRICPPHLCVIQKTRYGMELKKVAKTYWRKQAKRLSWVESII